MQSNAASSTPTTHRLHNLRPVGGLPAANGQTVRGDRIWRSAAPFTEREAASQAVVDLGVRNVIDLRDAGERDRTPGAWQHQNLIVHALPVFGDQLHTIKFDELADLYNIMVDHQGGQIAQAFSVVAEHSDEGVLFHCTAGKDRTGILSALVLEVLGVDRALTLTDFSLSQQHLGPDYLADLFGDENVASLPGIAAHKATASPPELLEGALARIDKKFGSAADYLDANGVSEALLERIQQQLLTEDPATE